MLKDSTAVIGLGLGGMTVTYEFQERNYLTYSVNGSEQDIKSIPNAKNSMRLEGYDGLAGNRELAYEALKRNKHILKKLKEIEKKINIVIASGVPASILLISRTSLMIPNRCCDEVSILSAYSITLPLSPASCLIKDVIPTIAFIGVRIS